MKSSRKFNSKWLILFIYLFLGFALFLGIYSAIRLDQISMNIDQLGREQDVERGIVSEINFRFTITDTYAGHYLETQKQGNLLLFQQSFADLTTFLDSSRENFSSGSKKDLFAEVEAAIANYETVFNNIEAQYRDAANPNSGDLRFYISQFNITKNDVPEALNNLSLEVERNISSHVSLSQKYIASTRLLLTLLIIVMIVTVPLAGLLIIRLGNEQTRLLNMMQVTFEQKLKEQKTEVNQANDETKQFAYIVSHDLRSSLTNLKGFAKELNYSLDQIQSILGSILPALEATDREKLSVAVNQDIPEALSYINNSVNRMESYINAVLKLSRLGRRELVIKQIDPNPMVEEIVANLTYQLEERQGAVYAQKLPEVTADHTSMEQIFANILDNATKYWYPGRPLEIHITARQSSEETIFAIKDNGRGIAAQDMDKIFAPFQRIGSPKEQGEGMGMPYVQAIVRNMGGRIWIESELSLGSTVFFTIPGNLDESSIYG